MGCSAVNMPINTYLCNRIATAKIRNYAESVCILPDNSGCFDAFAECQADIQERRQVREDARQPVESDARPWRHLHSEPRLRHEA